MPEAKMIDVSTRAAAGWMQYFQEDGGDDLHAANFIRALAADRDRIAAENVVLREALSPFVTVAKQLEWAKDTPAMEGRNYIYVEGFCESLTLYPRHFFDARAALGGS